MFSALFHPFIVTPGRGLPAAFPSGYRLLVFHRGKSRSYLTMFMSSMIWQKICCFMCRWCWLGKQLDDKKVEPNSSLGKAVNYMLNHWKKLTLFLRVAKAPLDNNVCERAFNMSILHRKIHSFTKLSTGHTLVTYS